MILPGSYVFTIVLLLVSMLCWGSWANTLKMTGTKWRFELFYYDYSLGVLLASLIAAFTFGSLGWDGFSFLDDVRNAGKRQDLYAFSAGCIFNLANILLVGAISISGMAISFPVGIGLALIVGVVWSYALHPFGNLTLLATGCAVILAAIVVDAMAYRGYSLRIIEQSPLVVKSKQPQVRKGLIVAVISGLLMGSFYPLVEMSKETDVGLGPYSVGVVFAGGVFFSTFIYNLFFMNIPLQGKPVDITAYFRGSTRVHMLGVLGGAIWCTGAVANFVAARAEGAAQAGPAVSYAMGQGATLISAVWGLVVWKEFERADVAIKILLTTMLVLFVVGLALVSIAPLYGTH